MIHGDIRVNDKRIASWSAVRVEKTPKGINHYKVDLIYIEPDGVRHSRHTTIAHQFGDGSLVLAREILEWASKCLPPRDKEVDTAPCHDVT